MFFNNWVQIFQIIIAGTLTYAGLILMLRISGKRTLAQMNAFDFIVTVAFGSTLATAMLSKDVTLTEGLAAVGLLILLQFVVTWSSVRFKFINNLVKSEPRLLFYQGEFKDEAMKEERVEKEELLQAVRCEGLLTLSEIEAIVLETNGKFSIVKSSGKTGESSLQNIRKE